jgi:hypothetical protein
VRRRNVQEASNGSRASSERDARTVLRPLADFVAIASEGPRSLPAASLDEFAYSSLLLADFVVIAARLRSTGAISATRSILSPHCRPTKFIAPDPWGAWVWDSTRRVGERFRRGRPPLDFRAAARAERRLKTGVGP